MKYQPKKVQVIPMFHIHFVSSVTQSIESCSGLGFRSAARIINDAPFSVTHVHGHSHLGRKAAMHILRVVVWATRPKVNTPTIEHHHA